MSSLNPLSQLLEAALFAANRPLTLDELEGLDPDAGAADVRTALDQLREHYDFDGHAIELVELAGGFQILTRAGVRRGGRARPGVQRQPRLSAATLETLATIAYRQPVGRAEIEEIRGVNSGGVLRTLQERGLIEVVGRERGAGPSAALRHHGALPRDARPQRPRRPAAGRGTDHRAAAAPADRTTDDSGARVSGRGLMTVMRLQRFLARAGVASRRQAEELITAGKVRVDGKVAELGMSVDPDQSRITVGRKVGAPGRAPLAGVPQAARRRHHGRRRAGRRTVFDLIPDTRG